MAKHKPFSKSKRSFSGTTGMEANHPPEAIPQKESLLTDLLNKAKKNRRNFIPSFTSSSAKNPSSKTKPPLLFALPPELRQQIYTYVFTSNGLSDLRQHLMHGRFCLSRKNYTSYLGLRILLVSKQFYADALPIAYAQSIFYTSYRSTCENGTTSLFAAWNPDVRKHVKNLAMWSDPFSWGRTMGAIEGAGMKLRCLTLCDGNINNYMRDEGVNVCVAEWLLDIAKGMETLRELMFFLAKINAVFKGAADLRRAAGQVIAADLMASGEEMGGEGEDGEKDLEIVPFDPKTHSATIQVAVKGERNRKVTLTIATTTEAEEAGLLKERGAWDDGKSKGCFKFQASSDGQYNDIG
ncbi:hypothetical protein BLS_008194 [Venturia inaequalis]|uniref:Uncharacterized protein n=1 Tax=Venturia inaequalis TaxID=5025 RepID=A0A8H3U7A4_VENIN|nr:hypothetical protein BLS_008194 [Venturia inaequalis]KAE9967629.1 hypothetical protein EG328_008075 [Venturia inaequalis]KAE9985595.1 hypothetical protein EG327_004639 [Venturia inaequalis]